jgi:hypothetical protein
MRLMNSANPTPNLFEIFFPNAAKKIARVRSEHLRFVHYTSAAVALELLRKKEAWMRNVTTMNDYMEVRHGMNCLVAAYTGKPGQELKKALESIFPGLHSELERRFNWWLPYIENDTYITCLSEHLPVEDEHGRLSMWRAYGGTTGVALVFNSAALLSDTNALNAWSSPVAYLDEKGFAEEFMSVVDRMVAAKEFIRTQNQDEVLNRIFQMFRFAVVCTKHPGFAEELEWRVIHTPALEPSIRLLRSIEAIGGVPQIVFKIPLQDVPEEGLTGMRLVDLIDRIIIGPTDYPQVTAAAFHETLVAEGFADPSRVIRISRIPLRGHKS